MLHDTTSATNHLDDTTRDRSSYGSHFLHAEEDGDKVGNRLSYTRSCSWQLLSEMRDLSFRSYASSFILTVASKLLGDRRCTVVTWIRYHIVDL